MSCEYTSYAQDGIRAIPRRIYMESQDLRRPGRRALLSSDVRCYECSVRRSIVMSVPFSGTAVKHGKLPVSISSIRDEKSKI